MARGINKVILVGNLGADPEVRYTADGTAVANIRVATTETWKDKNSGERQEATEWHQVVLFSKLGEIAAQYLKKGQQVYIEGRLRTRKWTDQEGQDRYSTEVRADDMVMLGGNKLEVQASAPVQNKPAAPVQAATPPAEAATPAKKTPAKRGRKPAAAKNDAPPAPPTDASEDADGDAGFNDDIPF